MCSEPLPSFTQLPLNQILLGDCVQVLNSLPEKSVDLIFADPPYNLQLRQPLWRPNMTRVDAVDEVWDQFDSFQAYDEFSSHWLTACRRVLKDSGTIWVIGTYHNIFRIGKLMQDLGFWILNDVIWIKTNPMPNFRGVRFTNAHETLIWASKFKGAKYTFNHHAMKNLNEGLQMRSDWMLPICTGRERLRIDGQKAHSTQKPEALLYRVILSSSKPGDVVLDPFLGSGTTAVVAKKLHRHWVGIESDPYYVQVAQQRIAQVVPEPFDGQAFAVEGAKRLAPRVEFSRLLEAGLVRPGQRLFFMGDRSKAAQVKADGRLRLESGVEGSIHTLGKHLANGSPCNGWQHWYYQDSEGRMQPIDVLREQYRRLHKPCVQEEGEAEYW
ncbi:MAG: DNA methyltransferase [Anaerolineales bacterium]|nr:DNA methyltransferase [Anaerolineales bacterium]MDW8448114.1 DNA methyltransferase [Anaerolineales bacterium]